MDERSPFLKQAMPLWTVFLLCLIALGAGIAAGERDARKNAPTSSEVRTTSPAQQCSAVYVEGAVITQAQADAGCLVGARLTVDAQINCTDGRRLIGRDRDPSAWAFIGNVVHVTAGEVASDPGYKAAYATCNA
jgi:hypothetical protein